MNKPLILLMTGWLSLQTAVGQAQVAAERALHTALANRTSAAPATELPLTRFDLDFQAGTPEQLVEAIEKAAGRPLNAIVPAELATVQLPGLKMKNVNVAQLFDALQAASQKAVAEVSGWNMPQSFGATRTAQIAIRKVVYGFRTNGQQNDDSIWYFFQEGSLPVPEPKENMIVRFHQLAPYLETYKIEDITTALQTAWKMLGQGAPTMNFHKDTKLLIAVGEESRLRLIDAVLAELSSGKKSQPAGFQAAKTPPTTPPEAK